MNITVKVEASELADAINNLAVALGNMLQARAELKAEKTAEAVVTKAQAKAVESDHEIKSAIQKVAQSKAKTAGAAKVKEVIAKYGESINATPSEMLVELKAELEALA